MTRFPKTLTRTLIVGSAAALAFATPAAADYPEDDINFVAWSSAGSPLDTMMRQVANLLQDEFDVNIPVDNRPGGSGGVAMSYVMSQPADGYTVLSTTSSMTFTMAQGQVPFTPDDFVVLRAMQAEPSSVAVLDDSPFETLDDFVEHLREEPNSLSVGGFATGGFHQFVLYQLQDVADFEVSWIPYDGGADAAAALLGGHLDAVVMTPSTALSQIESGEIRLLGISTDERSDYFPDVPTMQEQGYDVSEAIWRGIMVREGTPDDVIETLLDGLDTIQARDEWRTFQENNTQLDVDSTIEEINEQVRREVEQRRAFLEGIGALD